MLTSGPEASSYVLVVPLHPKPVLYFDRDDPLSAY